MTTQNRSAIDLRCACGYTTNTGPLRTLLSYRVHHRLVHGTDRPVFGRSWTETTWNRILRVKEWSFT